MTETSSFSKLLPSTPPAYLSSPAGILLFTPQPAKLAFAMAVSDFQITKSKGIDCFLFHLLVGVVGSRCKSVCFGSLFAHLCAYIWKPEINLCYNSSGALDLVYLR